MSDKEKFQVFKEKLVKENEDKYGKEVREKYGDAQADASNQKMLNMSEAEYERFRGLEAEIKETLKKCVQSKTAPESEEAKEAVRLHKEWLSMTWKQYSAEAHKGLAAMYVQDERFTSYYDEEQEGCAELLEKAVSYWAEKMK